MLCGYVTEVTLTLLTFCRRSLFFLKVVFFFRWYFVFRRLDCYGTVGFKMKTELGIPMDLRAMEFV